MICFHDSRSDAETKKSNSVTTVAVGFAYLFMHMCYANLSFVAVYRHFD
jgi:hypothetical protein